MRQRGNRVDFAGTARSAIATIDSQSGNAAAPGQGGICHPASGCIRRQCGDPDHSGCRLRDPAGLRVNLRCGGARCRTAGACATDWLRSQAGSRNPEHPLAPSTGCGGSDRVSQILIFLSRAGSAAARRGRQGPSRARRACVSHRSGNTLSPRLSRRRLRVAVSALI
jgi:hypothetical protein